MHRLVIFDLKMTKNMTMLSLEGIMRRYRFLLALWWRPNVFCYHVGPWVKFSEFGHHKILFNTFSAMITKGINIILFLLAAYYFIPVPIDDGNKDNLRFVTFTLKIYGIDFGKTQRWHIWRPLYTGNSVWVISNSMLRVRQIFHIFLFGNITFFRVSESKVQPENEENGNALEEASTAHL